MSDTPTYPKMKKRRLTGLFKRESQYGVFYSGKLDDGRQVLVHPPFEKKEDGPDLVLSVLVPDEPKE
jgi:hypothetical protein